MGNQSIVPHVTAAEKAPFATDQQEEGETAQCGLAFIAADDHRKAILYNFQKNSGSSSSNSLRLAPCDPWPVLSSTYSSSVHV